METLLELEERYYSEADPAERMDLISSLLCLVETDWRFVENFAARVILDDDNQIVRHEAAFVLGELRETGRIAEGVGAAALLKAATCDKSPVVRHEAAEAIYCFNSASVDQILTQLLCDEVEDVRVTAAISLSWRRKFLTSKVSIHPR